MVKQLTCRVQRCVLSEFADQLAFDPGGPCSFSKSACCLDVNIIARVGLNVTYPALAVLLLQVDYRPHTKVPQASKWVQFLELDGAKDMAKGHQPKVLILYGSLRERSYSKFAAYEFARILDVLGAQVRIYDPAGLPMKDEVSDKHEKVQELRFLSVWSEAQVWVCPEQHGTITGVFKNQIDWIPLALGSVRPTQGRVLAVAQVHLDVAVTDIECGPCTYAYNCI